MSLTPILLQGKPPTVGPLAETKDGARGESKDVNQDGLQNQREEVKQELAVSVDPVDPPHPHHMEQ